MKLNRLTGFSLVALATAPVAACGPKPNPTCDSGVWSPVVNGCVRPCGTRENPTYDDCYDTDAGVFIEAGSDRDARADGAAMDAVSEAGRDVALPDADASMEAAVEAGPACTAPEVDCGGTCVSTESSVAHCGACGRACTTSVANARPVCAMGACDFECAAGFELVGAACEVRVPRAIGPMTSATVTSQRPTLEWALPTGVTMATVDLCRDRAMTMGCTTLSATGSTVRPASALTAGVWFWRVRGRANGTLGTRTSPVWWFRVGHGDAAVDTFHGVELDVNGDGWADLAAVGNDDAGAPRVRVHLGGSSGVAVTPARELEQDAAFESFGWRVAAAGDINGDGFGDLLVAVPSAVSRGMRLGQLRVYFGSASGVAALPSQRLDGEQVDAQFGREIAAVNDVNGDGFGDVVVGTQFYGLPGRSQAGRVWLYLGSSTGLRSSPARAWDGASAQAALGYQVVGVGDVNGDRLGDFAASAPYANERSLELSGAAYAFLGNRAVPSMAADTVLAGSAAGAQQGEGIAFVGDITGDGFADFAVGRRGAPPVPSYAGVVQFFRGSAAGLSLTAVATISGVEENARVFELVRGIGDVNGDGRGDVAIGAAPTAGVPTGALRLYWGQPSGVLTMPDATLVEPGTYWGSFATLGGHYDHDGFADVLVVSPCIDASASLRQVGRLNWFRGGRTGLELPAVRSIEGANSGSCLGGSSFGPQFTW